MPSAYRFRFKEKKEDASLEVWYNDLSTDEPLKEKERLQGYYPKAEITYKKIDWYDFMYY